MKRFLLLLLTLPFVTACETGTDEELFTQLSVRLVLPDNRAFERIDVVADTSYFKNLNTQEKFPFPEVEGRSATAVLPKGVYTLMLNANVRYADSSLSLVRVDDYNTQENAVAWMNDESSIVLLLKFVK